MTKDEFYDIVDVLDWKESCENGDKRPYYKLAVKMDLFYPDVDIDEMRSMSKDERAKLGDWCTKQGIETHSFSGSDSSWDAGAHIIGCGAKFIEQFKKDILSGKYKDIYDIMNQINYTENFDYSFTQEHKDNKDYQYWYKRLNRPEKIKQILNN